MPTNVRSAYFHERNRLQWAQEIIGDCPYLSGMLFWNNVSDWYFWERTKICVAFVGISEQLISAIKKDSSKKLFWPLRINQNKCATALPNLPMGTQYWGTFGIQNKDSFWAVLPQIHCCIVKLKIRRLDQCFYVSEASATISQRFWMFSGIARQSEVKNQRFG